MFSPFQPGYRGPMRGSASSSSDGSQTSITRLPDASALHKQASPLRAKNDLVAEAKKTGTFNPRHNRKRGKSPVRGDANKVEPSSNIGDEMPSDFSTVLQVLSAASTPSRAPVGSAAGAAAPAAGAVDDHGHDDNIDTIDPQVQPSNNNNNSNEAAADRDSGRGPEHLMPKRRPSHPHLEREDSASIIANSVALPGSPLDALNSGQDDEIARTKRNIERQQSRLRSFENLLSLVNNEVKQSKVRRRSSMSPVHGAKASPFEVQPFAAGAATAEPIEQFHAEDEAEEQAGERAAGGARPPMHRQPSLAWADDDVLMSTMPSSPPPQPQLVQVASSGDTGGGSSASLPRASLPTLVKVRAAVGGSGSSSPVAGMEASAAAAAAQGQQGQADEDGYEDDDMAEEMRRLGERVYDEEQGRSIVEELIASCPATPANFEGYQQLDFLPPPTPFQPQGSPANTMLHMAAAAGNHERLAALLRQGKYIDAQDDLGRTALMYSVYCNTQECLNLLINQGAKVDHQAHDGTSALHYAAFFGSEETIMLLLKHGANLHTPDNEGRLPLHWAARNPNIGVMRILLRKHMVSSGRNVGVDLCDSAGMTPLMWAAYYDHPMLIQDLLAKGAQRMMRDMDGKTALHWAVHKDSAASLKMLVTFSSSFDMDKDGRTALHIAAEQGAKKASRLLLSIRPENANDIDNNGRTPLHWAAVCGHAKIVRLLMRAGANMDVADVLMRKPMDYASARGHKACVVALLEESSSAAPSVRSLSISGPSKEASISARVFQAPARSGDRSGPSPAVREVFKLLTVGSYMSKYTNGGKGSPHKRYFWVDLYTGEMCWAKSPEEFARDPSSASAACVVDVREHVSDVVRARADYVPEHHQFGFTVVTTGKQLDLVAPSHEIYQLWVGGLRCVLEYGDLLLTPRKESF